MDCLCIVTTKVREAAQTCAPLDGLLGRWGRAFKRRSRMSRGKEALSWLFGSHVFHHHLGSLASILTGHSGIFTAAAASFLSGMRAIFEPAVPATTRACVSRYGCRSWVKLCSASGTKRFCRPARTTLFHAHLLDSARLLKASFGGSFLMPESRGGGRRGVRDLEQRPQLMICRSFSYFLWNTFYLM